MRSEDVADLRRRYARFSRLVVADSARAEYRELGEAIGRVVNGHGATAPEDDDIGARAGQLVTWYRWDAYPRLTQQRERGATELAYTAGVLDEQKDLQVARTLIQGYGLDKSKQILEVWLLTPAERLPEWAQKRQRSLRLVSTCVEPIVLAMGRRS